MSGQKKLFLSNNCGLALALNSDSVKTFQRMSCFGSQKHLLRFWLRIKPFTQTCLCPSCPECKPYDGCQQRSTGPRWPPVPGPPSTQPSKSSAYHPALSGKYPLKRCFLTQVYSTISTKVFDFFPVSFSVIPIVFTLLWYFKFDHVKVVLGYDTET